jgi:ankyrin repeat protein
MTDAGGHRKMATQEARGRPAESSHRLLRRILEVFDAVDNGDLAKVAAWVSGGDNVNVTDPRLLGNGNTLLHHAANHGEVEIVRLLIVSDANVNAQCGCGWTPLIRACNSDHYEVAVMLLDAGADPTLRTDEGYPARGRTRASNTDLLLLIERAEHQWRRR